MTAPRAEKRPAMRAYSLPAVAIVAVVHRPRQQCVEMVKLDMHNLTPKGTVQPEQPETTFFGRTIKPIFAASCAFSNCHASSCRAKMGDLTAADLQTLKKSIEDGATNQ